MMSVNPRRYLIPVACFALTFVSAPAKTAVAEENRYQKWQRNRPFTIGAMYYDGGYGPSAQLPAPEGAQPDMSMFRYAGLNLLDEVSWSMGGHERYPGASAAQEAGIPFMILGAALQEDAEEAMNAFQSHVMFMTEDPRWSGLCGVQLADEPRNPINQANHRLQRDWLVQTYPRLLTLICEVLTDYPTCEKQYEAIRPDAFIYQWYPYHTSDTNSLDITPYMYACLERASKFCQERGIGFFIARGVTGPPKSDSLLRINTYAALAYGCKGFIDFSWDSSDRYKQVQLTPDPPDWGYVSYQRGKPRPTPHLEKLARINREVANIGSTLLDLRHIRTYHLDLETKSYGAEFQYHIDDMKQDGLLTNQLTTATGSTNRLMIGFFRDAQKEEYFMVVNKRNARNPNGDETHLLARVTLSFAGGVDVIQRLNRRTGHVENLQLKDHRYTFYLPGGTGELFKYGTAKPFIGVEE
ncbi:MAG: hypothetical protein ABGZ17_18260 [Planctomycetaceae bacterium]